MDVRQDAAAGDGDGAQELVELLVVADGELDVARDEESIQPASTFTEPSLLIRTSRGIRRLWYRAFI